MAHYRKTKSGKWEVEVSLGLNPANGRRKYKSKRFKRKKDAKDWAAKQEINKNMGIIIDAGDYTVEKYLNEWIDDHKSNISPTTYDGYNMIIKKHLNLILGKIKLNNLKPIHIKNYFKSKRKSGRADGKKGGLSQKTLLQHYRVLSKALKEAVKMELLKRNPAQAVSSPKPKKKIIQAMNEKEINKLLKTAKNENEWTYNFIYLAVKTGMRRGELLGLRWKDINFKEKRLNIKNTLVTTKNGTIFKEPKTNASIRPIEISDDVISVLKSIQKNQNKRKIYLGTNYCKEYNLVFCKDNGEKYYPDTPTRRFKRIAKKVNLGQYHLHTLRHTHATLLLKAGVHPKIVQERLGHSSITQTLDTYSHVIPSMQREAIEKLKGVI